MPTSVAARAPKACEMAVRCGTAVIGIQIEIAAPMPLPATRPTMIQPNVRISAFKQRADHGHEHSHRGQAHAVASFVRRGHSLQPKDEQHRGHQIRDLDEDFACVLSDGEAG